MIGVDYRIRINDLIQKAQKMRLLLLNAGLTTIRILPPLVINEQQVDKVLEIMHSLK